MFQNYSQSYAAAITTLAGLVVTTLAAFNINIIGEHDLSFLLGLIVNLIGAVWTILHRYKKGDVNVLGVRR